MEEVEDEAPTVVRNKATGMLHMSGTGLRLACGKIYPLEFETFNELPREGPRCPRCFGSLLQ